MNNMKKILKLTINKEWFSRILSGDKTEEYREIKPYWVARLLQTIAILLMCDILHWLWQGELIYLKNILTHRELC